MILVLMYSLLFIIVHTFTTAGVKPTQPKFHSDKDTKYIAYFVYFVRCIDKSKRAKGNVSIRLMYFRGCR